MDFIAKLKIHKNIDLNEQQIETVIIKVRQINSFHQP